MRKTPPWYIAFSSALCCLPAPWCVPDFRANIYIFRRIVLNPACPYPRHVKSGNILFFGSSMQHAHGCCRRSENAQSSAVNEGEHMLYYALVFLVIALIAGFLGFGGVAFAAAGIAKILFFVFLVIFVVTLLAHLLRGRPA
jgi:uncharacterized membrane protein YtjA (UPF0391 family)